jgi:hypothetical protein
MIDNKDDWGVAVVGHNVRVKANSDVKPKAMISEASQV